MTFCFTTNVIFLYTMTIFLRTSVLDQMTIFSKSHTYVTTNILILSSMIIPLLSWSAAYARLWYVFSPLLAWIGNIFCYVSFMEIAALAVVIDCCSSILILLVKSICFLLKVHLLEIYLEFILLDIFYCYNLDSELQKRAL